MKPLCFLTQAFIVLHWSWIFDRIDRKRREEFFHHNQTDETTSPHRTQIHIFNQQLAWNLGVEVHMINN